MSIIRIDYGNIGGKTVIDPQFSNKASASTHTLTDMEVGKHYIIIPQIVSGSEKITSGIHISAYTGCECTFIANSRNVPDSYSEYVVFAYYMIVPTETTVTLTARSYSTTLDIIKID